MVTEIGLRYKELNRNPQLKINIRIETEQVQLHFDADIITTILNNLLSNAMKYTPEGKIDLTLSSVIEANKTYTEIKVSDTGYGIDSKSLPYIFDRYYQAEGKHQASGTGIGLALVKSLASLHEGILDVKSDLGKGTTFSFRLLTENTYPKALHKESKQTVAHDMINLPEDNDINTRPSLLIVEDNDDIRKYIASSLISEYRIIEGNNGKEGLELAFTIIPNIIVSDIMMPEMDGIAFCRAIKADVRTSHIPVILLTAKDTIEDKEEGYKSGADSYLTKPFSAKLLQSRIQNLLESRKKLAKQIAVYTQGLKPNSSQEHLKMSKLDEEFLARLTKIIEDNLDSETLDISFITQRVNMSHSTFYRKVKGLTGMSANEYIRKVRLKNSLQLLQSGNYHVSEVAYMTGFNNLGYFRECFKEEYGVPPLNYLKK